LTAAHPWARDQPFMVMTRWLISRTVDVTERPRPARHGI